MYTFQTRPVLIMFQPLPCAVSAVSAICPLPPPDDGEPALGGAARRLLPLAPGQAVLQQQAQRPADAVGRLVPAEAVAQLAARQPPGAAPQQPQQLVGHRVPQAVPEDEVDRPLD